MLVNELSISKSMRRRRRMERINYEKYLGTWNRSKLVGGMMKNNEYYVHACTQYKKT